MIAKARRFRPHPLLRGGHRQTLIGWLLSGAESDEAATKHEVPLDDGDRIVLHDDCPADWKAGDPTVLMLHGLCGSHRSAYMVRCAKKLNERGVRTFRMDLRGCGAGLALARYPYHAGRSEDATAALEAIARLCPDSPTTLVGFSLGGNITLKLLGECGERGPGNLDRGAAVCPPVDLRVCADSIERPAMTPYRRYFLSLLVQHVEQRREVLPEAPGGEWSAKPKSVWEFDDGFTARICGFGSAENYYRACSSARYVPHIRLPALILTASDDPLVPVEPFHRLQLSDSTELAITEGGGHLGFISDGQADPDYRWMDWRLVEWILGREVQAEMAESANDRRQEGEAAQANGSERAGADARHETSGNGRWLVNRSTLLQHYVSRWRRSASCSPDDATTACGQSDEPCGKGQAT